MKETAKEKRNREQTEREAVWNDFKANILPTEMLALAADGEAAGFRVSVYREKDNPNVIIVRVNDDANDVTRKVSTNLGSKWELDVAKEMVQERLDYLREQERRYARRKEILASLSEEDRAIILDKSL